MFNWFKKKVTQELSDNQYELVKFIDNECASQLQSPAEHQALEVKHIGLGFVDQMKPLAVQKKALLKALPSNAGYIPRTVAFVSQGGDWHFMIGVYTDNPDSYVTQTLFIDALTKTNSARKEKE